MSLRCTHSGALQAYPGQTAQTMMYQLEVPSGVGPGQQFQAQVGDQMMVITCPAGAGPGSTIQVHDSPPALLLQSPGLAPCLPPSSPFSRAVGPPAQVAGPSATVTGVPSSAPPMVTGVPVGAHGASAGAYGGGVYGGGAYGGGGPNVVLVDGGAPEGYVEVDEISPAGWCCLIAGCFFFPFNLLGLCMRERRLVPASHIYY